MGEFLDSEHAAPDRAVSEEPDPETEYTSAPTQTVVGKRPRSRSVEAGPSAAKRRPHRTPEIEIVPETVAVQRGTDLLEAALNSAFGSSSHVDEEGEAPLTRPLRGLRTTGPAVTGVEEPLLAEGEVRETVDAATGQDAVRVTDDAATGQEEVGAPMMLPLSKRK